MRGGRHGQAGPLRHALARHWAARPLWTARPLLTAARRPGARQQWASTARPARWSGAQAAGARPAGRLAGRPPLLHVRWASSVHWRPWSADTLRLARDTNKPVFLSSTHEASHLGQLMDRESFTKAEIAAALNTQYVPVRIDKERDAGVDTAVMLNLQVQTEGQGGWPLNAVLTPNGAAPFVAGGYWSRADLALILDRVAREWAAAPAACEQFAAARTAAVARAMHVEPHAEPVDPQRVHAAARDEYVDAGRAGPRFPMGFSLALLGGDVLAATLGAIARSGLCDQLGGGVHAYSQSADWHLPSFEKPLSAQAALLLACARFLAPHSGAVPAAELAHAADAVAAPSETRGETRGDTHGDVRALATGLVHTIRGLQGCSAISGDDPVTGAEGGCYLWTAEQFHRALQQGEMGLIERDMAEMFWGVNNHGNINRELDRRGDFYGKNVLSQYNSVDKVAEAFGQPAANVEKVVAESRRLLTDFRARTMPPHAVDANVVVAWNGLSIAALARAAVALPELRALALDTARDTAFRLLSAFGYGALDRTVAKGAAACCDDYAYLTHGLLELYAVERNPEWLRWAAALQTHQIDLFIDRKDGAFFYTQDDATLYIRPKYGCDGALPGYNGISALNLIRLANLTGLSELRDMSQRVIECYKAGLVMQPLAYLSILEAMKTLKL